MENKKYKVILSFLIIIMSFFVRNNVVKAYDCRYYTFDSYVNNDGVVVPKVDLGGSYHGLNTIASTELEFVKVDNAARHINITGDEVHFFNSYYGRSCYSEACDTWTESKEYYDESRKFKLHKKISTDCPRFIKVGYYDDTELEWSESSEKEFINYLKNPYKNIKSTGIQDVMISNFSNPFKYGDVVFIHEGEGFSYKNNSYGQIDTYKGKEITDPRKGMLDTLATGESKNGVDKGLFEDKKKGRTSSTELDSYVASADIWERKIDKIVRNLEEYCGVDYNNYKRSDLVTLNTNYIEFEGKDVNFSGLYMKDTLAYLATSDYSVDKNVSEQCKTAALKHAYAYDLFSTWFEKVDLWSFEQSLDIDSNKDLKKILINNFKACFNGEYDCRDGETFVNSYKMTEEDKKNINKIQFFKFYKFAGGKNIDKVIAYLHIYAYYQHSEDLNPCDDNLPIIDYNNVEENKCKLKEETKTYTSCSDYAGEMVGKNNSGSNAANNFNKYKSECESKMVDGKFTITYNERNQDTRNYCECKRIYNRCEILEKTNDAVKDCAIADYSKYLEEQGYNPNDINDVISLLGGNIDKTLNEKDGALEAIYSAYYFDTGTIEVENVKWDPECSQFNVFKWAWNIIIYSAPFLLILFGSIDYLKVVTAGDQDAIKKAKKNFKTRVIAFVILLVIPVFIRLLLSYLGADDSSSTIEALKCIIN